MQINALRKELADLLETEQMSRQPAVRRSSRDEWIYATDIPGMLSESALKRIRTALSAAGWESAETGGWLFLRKDAAEPPEGWYTKEFGPEAACCASLLERHEGSPEAGTEEIRYMLIKAGEEGAKAYEGACRALHRQWAELLRQGKPLPSLSSRFFEA